MPKQGKPSAESQVKFERLMEIYDKGLRLDPTSRADLIARFFAVSQPGVERKIKGGWLTKAQTTSELVSDLCWGLNEFREGRQFMREGKPTLGGPAVLRSSPVEKFEDGIQWDLANGRVVRVGSSGLQHMFLTLVFEVLTEVAPWLRVCERKECRRLFLFQRSKQVYCSDSCAQRVRMERFLAQRGAQNAG
jgi:hypothetical protein